MVREWTRKTSKAAWKNIQPCEFLLSSLNVFPVPIDNSTIDNIGPGEEEVTGEEWEPSIGNSHADAREECNIIIHNLI